MGKLDNFAFEDRALLELNGIIGSIGILHAIDPDSLEKGDLEKFANTLAWRTEALKIELEEYFYPKIKEEREEEKEKKVG